MSKCVSEIFAPDLGPNL